MYPTLRERYQAKGLIRRKLVSATLTLPCLFMDATGHAAAYRHTRAYLAAPEAYQDIWGDVNLADTYDLDTRVLAYLDKVAGKS